MAAVTAELVVALVPVVYADPSPGRTPTLEGPTAQVSAAAAVTAAAAAAATAIAAANFEVARDHSLQHHFQRRSRVKDAAPLLVGELVNDFDRRSGSLHLPLHLVLTVAVALCQLRPRPQ